MCTCECIIFFFFKQKTAYEMRISDWSSDVCSSDLDMADILVVQREDRHAVVQAGVVLSRLEDTLHAEGLTLGHDPWTIGIATEIGRASCRERVCQYV